MQMQQQRLYPCLDNLLEELKEIQPYNISSNQVEESHLPVPSAPTLEEFDDWTLQQVDSWILEHNLKICPWTLPLVQTLEEPSIKVKRKVTKLNSLKKFFGINKVRKSYTY